MVTEIVKRKKKGRPSKADLARRRGRPPSPAEERRRSLRRRNVRYNNNFIDYDDYLDEYEEEELDGIEDFDELRRRKKLKLIVKLHNNNHHRHQKLKSQGPARGAHARGLDARGQNGSLDSAASEEEEEEEEEEREVADDDEEEEEEEEEEKRVKRRRIVNGNGDGDGDSEEESGSDNGDGDDDGDEDDDRGQERERKRRSGKLQDVVPGTTNDQPNGLPLPDKKKMELILDKLQKKDTYGVYSEPVDLEELPDYLDVVDHPMDFATVRKKLQNGSYSTLEQFESDVFLICSNAMQYNSPDTVYHKQARAIQELAGKKFEKLRVAVERLEKELKSEPETKSNSSAKKPTKKPFGRAMQEPAGSDFSSCATLATAGDGQNGSVATQFGSSERPSNVDALVEGHSLMLDSNVEKLEELSSGKGLPSKFERKPPMVDENRRATYATLDQPVARPESIFTTFEDEIKQLVAVGLHAEYSYSRSLACFAAMLGPVAWKVASKRIEEALPPGCKFGRGWVGEYEPLRTPVLMLGKQTPKEPNLFKEAQSIVDPRNGIVNPTISVPAKGHPVREPASNGNSSLFRPTSGPLPAHDKERIANEPVLEGKTSLVPPGKPSPPVNMFISEGKTTLFSSAGMKSSLANVPSSEGKTTSFSSHGTRHHPANKSAAEVKTAVFPPGAKPSSVNVPISEGKASLLSPTVIKPTTSVNSTIQKPTLPPRSFADLQNKSSKQVELNFPPSSYQRDVDVTTEKQIRNNSIAEASKPQEMLRANGVGYLGLPNGVVGSSAMCSRMVGSSSANVHNQMAQAARHVSQGLEQGLTDPVEAMRISTEKAQKQYKHSNNSSGNSAPVIQSSPSTGSNASNAAVAAAHAWMSVGAAGFRLPMENSKTQVHAEPLYNLTRQFQAQIPGAQAPLHSRPAGVQLPLQAFMPQPIHGGNVQFQNRPPMVFPQLVGTDLSRFQMQSPWRAINPISQKQEMFAPIISQAKQKQETVAPDLNIGFQSPGSPVKQSSGVSVDSQQPDLALQL